MYGLSIAALWAAMLAGILLVGHGISILECRAQWKDSGMDYRKTMLGGCQVKAERGWIPAKNLRDM